MSISDRLADFNFFQIYVIADIEFEDKIYPNVKQRNNDSILTPENWEQSKDIFFEQRMTQYKESYTISEKLKLEFETVEKLPINKTDYKILKDRYKKYLIEQPQPEAPELNNISTTEKYLGQPTNEKANDFFDFLIEYYRPEEKTQIKYVNILHFLKNDADKKHFIFRVKQKEYKILVTEKTGIEIKKFAKSERYNEDEKSIFHSLENTFLKTRAV